MPLGIYNKLEFTISSSATVLSVELHPDRPWILGGLSDGTMDIWDYEKLALIDKLDVPSPSRVCSPVWSAKFVPRKQWVVAGSGDGCICVYKWYTMNWDLDSRQPIKVISDAHAAAVMCLAVHPTLPYLLSSSHDNTIKLWNWDLDWCCTRVFVGHSASVVHVTFNPKENNTFASASLDNTTKIWSLGSHSPQCTLGGEEHQEGHLEGVLCVDYFTLSDKPYLITCSADQTAKVWDYQTKRCLQTLEGHTNSVTAVCFHPVIPIIITVSEDATACIWHATTFRLEKTLKLKFNPTRCFAIGHRIGSYQVVFGCLRGPVLMEFSLEIPLASMDKKGTIVFAKHREIYIGSAADKGTGVERLRWGFERRYWDFERHPWVFRHLLTTCDFYPEDFAKEEAQWIELGYVPPGTTFPQTSVQAL